MKGGGEITKFCFYQTLSIDLGFLLSKAKARLNLKIDLGSWHIGPRALLTKKLTRFLHIFKVNCFVTIYSKYTDGS